MADMAIGVTAIIAMPAIIVTIAMLEKRKTITGEKEQLKDVIAVIAPDWPPRDATIS